MAVGEIANILPKLSGEGASQALQSLGPDKAAEALEGNTPESNVRMMAHVFAGNVAEILSCMQPDAAAATICAMPGERAAEVIGTMQANDATQLMKSMSSVDIADKSEMFADVIGGMKEDDMLVCIRELMNSQTAEKGLKSVLDKMPARIVAELTGKLNAGENTKLLSGLSHERTAAIVSKLPVEQQSSVIGLLGGDSMFQMTKSLHAAYKVDKNSSAQERSRMKADAQDTGHRLAPALATMETEELRENFKQATAEHIAGCLFALIDAKRRQIGTQAIARPVAQMMENGSIEWGDGSIS
jgi:Mg/Co/Ni transporter MgtE